MRWNLVFGCVFAAAACFSANTYGAGLSVDAEAALKQMVMAIQGEMFFAYVCRDEIGTSYYSAAILSAQNQLQSTGSSYDDAVLQVDQYEGFIKDEIAKHGGKTPISAFDHSDRQSICFDQIADYQHKEEVAGAKARKALGIR